MIPATQLVKSDLLEVWMTILRNRVSSPSSYRGALRNVSFHLFCVALKEFPVAPYSVNTSLDEVYEGRVFAKPLACATIFPSGLVMDEALRLLLPETRSYQIVMYPEVGTSRPLLGLNVLPKDCSKYVWLVADPACATGGLAVATIKALFSRGAGDIRYVCVVAAPEGLQALRNEFGSRDLKVFTAAIDRGLTDGSGNVPSGYIVPGFGDVGDRQFGTGDAYDGDDGTLKGFYRGTGVGLNISEMG